MSTRNRALLTVAACLVALLTLITLDDGYALAYVATLGALLVAGLLHLTGAMLDRLGVASSTPNAQRPTPEDAALLAQLLEVPQ